ncbi:MAG: hypothetical protein ABFC71_09440 [Methanoregula sp.]
MKFAKTTLFVITLAVIAVFCAGCASTSPSAPAAGTTTGNTAPAGASPTAGSVVSGQSVLGNANYNWMEYKTVTNSGGETVTMIYRYEKSGACKMTITSSSMPSPMTMDCSSQGTQTASEQSNPNDIKSDVQFTFVGIEPVTVPAGTYATASKYSITSPQSGTMYYWTAPGVPGFIKYEVTTSAGVMKTELNGWG